MSILIIDRQTWDETIVLETNFLNDNSIIDRQSWDETIVLETNFLNVNPHNR